MATLAAVIALVIALNLSVSIPVAARLSQDQANSGIVLVGYRSFGMLPTEITLDLWSIDDEKAPIDLFRSLFQAAGALKDRHFSKVILARSGRPLFTMSGDDFAELGSSYDGSENPIYLLRTLPEKLHRPDGTAAFGSWEGGWLGVMARQLEDLTAFGVAWSTGEPPTAPAP